MDSKQHGLASMACLGSLAAAQRHRSTSVRRQRSKPVRPTASLPYLEGSSVEPPCKVHETRIQRKSSSCPSKLQRVRGAVACTLRVRRAPSAASRVQSGTVADTDLVPTALRTPTPPPSASRPPTLTQLIVLM